MGIALRVSMPGVKVGVSFVDVRVGVRPSWLGPIQVTARMSRGMNLSRRRRIIMTLIVLFARMEVVSAAFRFF